MSYSDISNALFKRCKQSNYQDCFKDIVIIFNSCYSGDFVDKLQIDLKNKLKKAGVNPQKLEFPIIITGSEKNSFASAPIIQLISDKIEDDGKFTYDDFLTMKNEISWLTIPTLWYTPFDINAVDICGEFCQGL